MIKIVIIGAGNVAQHLIQAFQCRKDFNPNIELVQVYSRNKQNVAHLLNLEKIISDYQTIVDADLYIMAVSDDAISGVSSEFIFKDKLVVHTAGTVNLTEINSKNRRGVFYPLQTFSKNKSLNFKEIPICLEAETKEDLELLKQIAHSISDNVYEIDSKQRKALHIGAVFVNNFVNHLYQIGDAICIENNIPFDILKPLIQETANKINFLSPKMAQTGPAKRNDVKTIQAHQDFLTNETHLTIYKILTQSIQKNGEQL